MLYICHVFACRNVGLPYLFFCLLYLFSYRPNVYNYVVLGLIHILACPPILLVCLLVHVDFRSRPAFLSLVYQEGEAKENNLNMTVKSVHNNIYCHNSQ